MEHLLPPDTEPADQTPAKKGWWTRTKEEVTTNDPQAPDTGTTQATDQAPAEDPVETRGPIRKRTKVLAAITALALSFGAGALTYRQFTKGPDTYASNYAGKITNTNPDRLVELCVLDGAKLREAPITDRNGIPVAQGNVIGTVDVDGKPATGLPEETPKEISHNPDQMACVEQTALPFVTDGKRTWYRVSVKGMSDAVKIAADKKSNAWVNSEVATLPTSSAPDGELVEESADVRIG